MSSAGRDREEKVRKAVVLPHPFVFCGGEEGRDGAGRSPGGGAADADEVRISRPQGTAWAAPCAGRWLLPGWRGDGADRKG